jgi:pimeloyl-ACP methyl ester carboxylesterase
VVVSLNDRMLPPAMEEDSAKRLHAHVTKLPTCHLAMLEAPEKVAAVIEDDANGSVK